MTQTSKNHDRIQRTHGSPTTSTSIQSPLARLRKMAEEKNLKNIVGSILKREKVHLDREQRQAATPNNAALMAAATPNFSAVHPRAPCRRALRATVASSSAPPQHQPRPRGTRQPPLRSSHGSHLRFGANPAGSRGAGVGPADDVGGRRHARRLDVATHARVPADDRCVFGSLSRALLSSPRGRDTTCKASRDASLGWLFFFLFLIIDTSTLFFLLKIIWRSGTHCVSSHNPGNTENTKHGGPPFAPRMSSPLTVTSPSSRLPTPGRVGARRRMETGGTTPPRRPTSSRSRARRSSAT